MTYTLQLPYSTPPLNANQRLHWARKASITRQLRHDTQQLAQASRLPKGCGRVVVGLHYAPARNGRRDADNLVPTLKACCDGLVDYGLVPDDTPAFMDKRMPVIEAKEVGGRLWLELHIEEAQ